jgi:RimJ/RimL family protein N-acetyltransferase
VARPDRVDPAAVRLERIPVAVAEALVRGDLERPATWDPGFPAEGTLSAARMLLGAYEALGRDPGDSPWWFFAVVVEGADERGAGAWVVGDAGFHGPPPDEGTVEVEVGYQVVPGWRGRGVATRACALLLEHAWRHGAELVRAEVEPDNPDGDASRAVLLANGFRAEGQLGFVVERPVGRPA